MARGIAIHIGLNHVDPGAYVGWDGALDACENDARSMEEITGALGYETRTLFSTEATAEAVFDAIAAAAASLRDGDICVITYAGHGGQFDDLGADESDSRDETWLLFDREVLDDEIHVALSAFGAGVRVIVISDSCHSGTVVRAFYLRSLEEAPDVRKAYERVAPSLPSRGRARKRATRTPRFRGAPAIIQRKVLANHRALYEGIKAGTPARDTVTMRASVILISGCQDNQESMELDGHGVFTAALLQHWDKGAFSGDYTALHAAIRQELPPTQSPNLLRLGTAWPAFDSQTPFTIQPPGDTAPPPDDQSPQRIQLSVRMTVAGPSGEEILDVLRTFAEVDGPARARSSNATDIRQEELVRMHRTGEFSVTELAELFGVPSTVVQRMLGRGPSV
ncbi:caspase family protein [Nonomuraea sp. ZG12]|uniref:caspase family protein n=1 Tax=Nonomuraea sp. ZG12 TaxID=3452207 RepID=UPI003F8A736B